MKLIFSGLKIKEKVKTAKVYFESDNFEDELDYFILNLQMFDPEISVPDMSRNRRIFRINKKLRILRHSFKRLNLNYAPYGMAAGAFFGPKGTAAGSFLGTYIFLGCASASIWRHFGAENQDSYLLT